MYVRHVIKCLKLASFTSGIGGCWEWRMEFVANSMVFHNSSVITELPDTLENWTRCSFFHPDWISPSLVPFTWAMHSLNTFTHHIFSHFLRPFIAILVVGKLAWPKFEMAASTGRTSFRLFLTFSFFIPKRKGHWEWRHLWGREFDSLTQFLEIFWVIFFGPACLSFVICFYLFWIIFHSLVTVLPRPTKVKHYYNSLN